ncbi:MAG: TIGR02757 family protein [Candidatus Methylomirabilales bacterium]
MKTVGRSQGTLAVTLERLYRTYDLTYLQTSALKFPHRYARPNDQEVVGFLAAALAYGRVECFTPVLDRFLALLGPSPAAFVRNFDRDRHGSLLASLYYRFNTAADLGCLLVLLRQVLARYGSLEGCFLAGYTPEDPDIRPALTSFAETLLAGDPRPYFRPGTLSPGMTHLVPSPRAGGACKRLNLFLRWMVRQGDPIDFGLWRTVDPAKLIIPLDTHVARVAQVLGLTMRRTPDWLMAEEITRSLRRFDPRDPVKYDFALCRYGMLNSRSRKNVHGSGFTVHRRATAGRSSVNHEL